MKFILILCSLITYSLFGQVLILQFSDTHSAYDNIETFTQNISQQINEFKEVHPQGEVLFIHSGDISGVSQFTYFDKGSANYDYFAALSREHHFTLTMGNHDGADWNFETLMNQVKYFENVMSENSKPNWKMLAANITTNDSSLSQHFQAHQDINLLNGKKIRVVGLVLDKLLSYTHKSLSQSLVVHSMIETAKKQFIKAFEANIDRIIFSAHEELKNPNMQAFEKELAQWLELNPKYKSVKSDLIFSAHDHSVQIYQGVKSQITSSGSAYNYFSKTILGKDLRIKSPPVHIEASKPLPLVLMPEHVEQSVLMIKEEIVKTNEMNKKVVAYNPVELQKRSFMKLRPHHNGVILSTAMTDWAKTEVAANEVVDYIAFFNSGSYRASDSIGPGDFTYGDIKTISPFPDELRIIIANGSDIQNAFRGLRELMTPEHTPQLPANIREIPLGSKILHRYDQSTRSWIVLESNKKFALALDGWLGGNGFKVKEFTTLFKNSEDVKLKLSQSDEVLEHFLPKVLKEQALQIKADCDKLYLNP